MSGTAQFQITNFSTDLGSAYKTKLDGNAIVAQQIAAAFQCYANSPVAMNVKVAQGSLAQVNTVLAQGIQTSGTIVAPSVNPRIDRVVVNLYSGVAAIVTGLEAASPVAPPVPNGNVSVAQIALVVGSTFIANTMITDERALIVQPPAPMINRLRNGDWMIDQINEGALFTMNNTGGQQTVDGWYGVGNSSGGVYKVRRVVDPDFASQFAMEITCTTIRTIVAGDLYYIYQNIEGYDVADLRAGLLSAAPITIAFEMKFSVAGVYGLSLRNSASNRVYVGTVTQNVASVRESKVVTLTLDTTGTWLYGNNIGLQVAFCLAAGSTFQGTAGAWGASNIYTTASQVNFLSNVANIGYLGPIRLLPGIVSIPPYMQETYDIALRRCQRHYYKSFPQGTAVAQAAGVAGAVVYQALFAGVKTQSTLVNFPTTMRATGVTLYSPVSANATWRGATADSGAGNTADVSTNGVALSNSQVAGDAAGDTIRIHFVNNGRLS